MLQKKKKVDFLIVYEHKARELESACLLRYELEKRGYSVEIVYNNFYNRQSSVLYFADIVLIPACYNDFSIHFFTHKLVKYKKIVDMQWEQVFSIRQEREGKIRQTSGAAKHVLHLSWGKRNAKWLMQNCHIDPYLVVTVGNIALDFLRPEMRAYYLSRKKLLQLYGIPEHKKVCLFISSFSYVNFTQNDLDYAISILGQTAQNMYDASCTSQQVILGWIRKVLQENPNLFFIYRPHPAEVNSPLLIEMEETQDNFRIIRDRSVKQWIITCDVVYTWISTSITEVYYAGKICHILRPYPISQEDDNIIYSDAIFIKDYMQFKDSISQQKNIFPISHEIFANLYDYDLQNPTYKRIVDLLEKVREDKKYILPRKEILRCNNYPPKSFFNQFKIWVYRIIEMTFLIHIYRKLFNKGESTKTREDNKILEMLKNDFAKQEEIQSITNLITQLLDKDYLTEKSK